MNRPHCQRDCVLHPVGVWMCRVCGWDDWGLTYDENGNKKGDKL